MRPVQKSFFPHLDKFFDAPQGKKKSPSYPSPLTTPGGKNRLTSRNDNDTPYSHTRKDNATHPQPVPVPRQVPLPQLFLALLFSEVKVFSR